MVAARTVQPFPTHAPMPVTPMTVMMEPKRTQVLRSLGWICLTAFLAEYVIMLLLPLVSLELNQWLETLVDAMALTVIVATVSHFWVFPALVRQMDELAREAEEGESDGMQGVRRISYQSSLHVILLKFGLVIFMAESGVMLVAPLISLDMESHQVFGLLDAALLTLIMAPITYFWILKDFWRTKQRWQEEITPGQRDRMQFSLFLTVFIPAVIFLVLLHLGLYQSEQHAARRGLELEVGHHLEMISRDMRNLFQGVRDDLGILSRQVELQELLEGEQEARELLERDYVNFLSTRTLFSHIALVTLGGQEIVRVERHQGDIRSAPWSERLNRALDQGYQHAVQLGNGEVYISGIRYLREDVGEVIPVFWFATPVFLEEEKVKRGVLFIAVRAEVLRSILELPGTQVPDHLYLLDGGGEVLIQRDVREGMDRERSFSRLFPAAWSAMAGREAGTLRNQEGFFAHIGIPTLGNGGNPAPVSVHDHDQPQTGGGEGNSTMTWSLVSHVSPSSEAEMLGSFRGRLALLFVLLSSLLAGGSWHLARTVLSRRLAEAELAGYARELEKMVQERTKQLVHAERLASLGTFSAGMAHEINNPNSFVSGNVQFLQMVWKQLKPVVERHVAEDPKGRLAKAVNEVGPTLDGILDGSRRIAKIVDSLKTYSRGGGEADKVDCRLLDPVNDALTLLKHRLREGVTVTVDISPSIMIHGDRQQISQVYVNLVNNAMDAMEGTGMGAEKRITLKAEVIDDHVWMRVQDNGPGIPPEASGKIFDPFYTTKGKTKGTGLGLSIVHGIVEDHRGQITVFSAPGQETEFLMILPSLTLYRQMHSKKNRQ